MLRCLALQMSENRHCDCAETRRATLWAPRVDAQASSDRTGIGGWEPWTDERGVIDKSKSRWFSLEITKEKWPWVYYKGDRPALVISTLEALAVLVSLKAFHGNVPRKGSHQVQVLPTLTDNRGNRAALNKLMTTRYPANAFLMEKAAYFKHMRLRALVEWTSMAGNREADALVNGDTTGFDPALEVKIDDQVLKWLILPEVRLEDRLKLADPGDDVRNSGCL